MGAGTAGARLGKTKEEGQDLLDKFFAGFPQLKNTIEYSKKLLKEQGYVEDAFGRRRNLKHVIDLPNYEVKLKDSTANSNFNPFIGCTDRRVPDANVVAWQKIIEAYIKLSNSYQAKYNPNFKSNNEMSNKKFEWLAKIALNPEYEGKQAYKVDSKTGKVLQKVSDKIKQDTGISLPTVPVILTAWTGKKAQAERQCFNARIQGSAASLTKLAMIKINNDSLMQQWDAHLVISVHDEVLVECPAIYAELVEERLPKLMVEAATENGITIPFKCDPATVDHWYIDEFSVAIQDEFKKLEEGDIKKGIAPLSRDEAFKTVIINHPELSAQSIRDTIEKGIEIVL